MTAMTMMISNAHLSAREAEALLHDELAALASGHGGSVKLQPFGLHKTGADATTKMFVRTTTSERILAVLILSRRAAPDLIDRGVRTAEEIRSMIGAELGAAIIEPLGHGYVDGISYVLLPCCREFSAWRPWRIVQRGRLRGPIFRWLHSAARAAADHHAGRSDAAENFHHAVEHLLRQPSLSDEIARAARGALARLESKAWRPRHSFDHNDLYLSNIMLPGMDARASSRHPFVLIDWAGANPDGFGMYDLMRLARAFRLPVAKIRGELVAHASALHCQTSDLSGHLLASLGRLHQHLEHFPEDRFMAIADVCWALYRQSAEGSGR